MKPHKGPWTEEEKKAHAEKAMWARLKGAAAYKGCSLEELAEMSDYQLRITPNLGRKSIELLKNWAKNAKDE
jgi:hypothetical protein